MGNSTWKPYSRAQRCTPPPRKRWTRFRLWSAVRNSLNDGIWNVFKTCIVIYLLKVTISAQIKQSFIGIIGHVNRLLLGTCTFLVWSACSQSTYKLEYLCHWLSCFSIWRNLWSCQWRALQPQKSLRGKCQAREIWHLPMKTCMTHHPTRRNIFSTLYLRYIYANVSWTFYICLVSGAFSNCLNTEGCEENLNL